MAKKKKQKQKKAGIEKRRKNKQERRVASKKKAIAQQPVQKKISPAKLKQNLKNIPSLIFEPELQEIAFTAEQIKDVQNRFEKVPDQIEALATPDFLEDLKTRHETMKLRFEEAGDTNKTMMAHAIIYFMEQEEAPPFLNQIIVAMYYHALHQMDSEEPLSLKQLNLLLKEYERNWADYMQEKAQPLEEVMAGSEMGTLSTADDEEEATAALEASPFEAVIEAFAEHLESELSLEEEQRERMVEDVEVLVNDYFEEKGITELESIRSRRIKSFLESWFISIMHPTKEDLELMFDSLETFFNFAIQHDKITEEKGKEILAVFENKETFLSNLEI